MKTNFTTHEIQNQETFRVQYRAIRAKIERNFRFNQEKRVNGSAFEAQIGRIVGRLL